MEVKFPIRLCKDRPGVAPVAREPVVGRWYVGINVLSTYAFEVRPGDMDMEEDGELMRYEGDGVWSGDDSESDPEPGDYDYLQEQH